MFNVMISLWAVKKSMLKFKYNLLSDKWAGLIIAKYKGNEHYEVFYIDYMNILKNQIILLNMRKRFVEIISINNYENITFITNLTEIIY